MTCLPVPLSPVISTGRLVPATFIRLSLTAAMAAVSPNTTSSSGNDRPWPDHRPEPIAEVAVLALTGCIAHISELLIAFQQPPPALKSHLSIGGSKHTLLITNEM